MGVPPEVWTGVGIGSGWALAAYFFRLVYTGSLVPAHDRDEWRAECRIKDQHIGELTEQNSVLLREYGPAVSTFMQSLRTHADNSEVEP